MCSQTGIRQGFLNSVGKKPTIVGNLNVVNTFSFAMYILYVICIVDIFLLCI